MPPTEQYSFFWNSLYKVGRKWWSNLCMICAILCDHWLKGIVKVKPFVCWLRLASHGWHPKAVNASFLSMGSHSGSLSLEEHKFHANWHIESQRRTQTESRADPQIQSHIKTHWTQRQIRIVCAQRCEHRLGLCAKSIARRSSSVGDLEYLNLTEFGRVSELANIWQQKRIFSDERCRHVKRKPD